MKLTKNIVTNLCLECYEDMYQVSIKRTRSLNESRNTLKRKLSSREHAMLKEAIRLHMLEEGFFDGVKNLLKKGKAAASSFISKFKSAPKTFKKVRELINRDVSNLSNNILPVEATPRSVDWEDVMQPLTQIVFMALGILSGSEKGFMTRFKGWRKHCNSVQNWYEFDAPGFDNVFNVINYVDSSKLDKVIEAITDGDLGDISKGGPRMYLDVMVGLQKNLRPLQRKCDLLARKLSQATKEINKKGKVPSDQTRKYFRTRQGEQIKKIVGSLADDLSNIRYQ